MINPEIQQFLESEIIPMYDSHDAAHGRDHVHHVMAESQNLAKYYPEVDRNMLLVAAAYHDVGLAEGRKSHHVASARMIRHDARLLRWFTPEQIDTIADAAEDHRASLDHDPRSIYGRIIAESDRQIDGDTIIRRTIQFGLANYPDRDEQQQYQRFLEHMQEKYASGGYLKLWIPQSDNAQRLTQFRALINHPDDLKARFTTLYNEITNQSQI